jgi:uncharacterized protein (DUF111 family)
MQPYEFISVNTKLGAAKVNVACCREKTMNRAPEYENCRKLAEKHLIPPKEVYDLAKNTAYLRTGIKVNWMSERGKQENTPNITKVKGNQ